MIEIEGKIVSTDILTEPFCCDLSVCKGECCIEGDSGAPLELDEVDILEEEYEMNLNSAMRLSNSQVEPQKNRGCKPLQE